MFGRATITLGIGPHSSYSSSAFFLPLLLCLNKQSDNGDDLVIVHLVRTGGPAHTSDG